MIRAMTCCALALLLACSSSPTSTESPKDDARVDAPATEDDASPAQPPPRFTVSRDGDGCPAVVAEGFPAISSDGATVVVPLANHRAHGSSPGGIGLQWMAVADQTARVDPVLVDREELDPERDCPAALADAEGRARALNEQLARRSWRALERLPPDAPAAAEADAEDAEDEDAEDADEDVEEDAEEHAGDAATVQLHSLFGDRRAGVVVRLMVESAFESMDCTPCFRASLERWDAARLAAIKPGACPRDPDVDEDPCETPGARESEGASPFTLP
ncbi:MAG: hypothetical protein H6713_34930 [Myxococcales bacterium]|nr:hypothetical protein [Myxococcales bacterium]